MMKEKCQNFSILLLVVTFCLFPLFGDENNSRSSGIEELDKISSAPTQIDAETMDFDIENRRAIFSGNVKVVDEKLNLIADEMTIQFDENQKLQRIEALGNVEIESDGNTATGGKAVYDFKLGKITLSNDPVLTQGPNRVVGAERIVYLRIEKKFTTEGGRPKIFAFESGDGNSFLETLTKKDRDKE